MKLNCQIKVKHNYKNIEAIINKLPTVAQESVEEIIKNIRGYAIRLENGHNSEGILCELIEGSTGVVKGRVYADPNKFMSNGQSYLWFEYFGTGQFAEQEHIGRTKHFIESDYTEWYIPKNKVDRALSYPVVTINGTEFYIAKGAKANHFMTDGEFQSRQENIEITKNKLEEMLREVCK